MHLNLANMKYIIILTDNFFLFFVYCMPMKIESDDVPRFFSLSYNFFVFGKLGSGSKQLHTVHIYIYNTCTAHMCTYVSMRFSYCTLFNIIMCMCVDLVRSAVVFHYVAQINGDEFRKYRKFRMWHEGKSKRER